MVSARVAASAAGSHLVVPLVLGHDGVFCSEVDGWMTLRERHPTMCLRYAADGRPRRERDNNIDLTLFVRNPQIPATPGGTSPVRRRVWTVPVRLHWNLGSATEKSSNACEYGGSFVLAVDRVHPVPWESLRSRCSGCGRLWPGELVILSCSQTFTTCKVVCIHECQRTMAQAHLSILPRAGLQIKVQVKVSLLQPKRMGSPAGLRLARHVW